MVSLPPSTPLDGYSIILYPNQTKKYVAKNSQASSSIFKKVFIYVYKLSYIGNKIL
jgi:hypothetical protein